MICYHGKKTWAFQADGVSSPALPRIICGSVDRII